MSLSKGSEARKQGQGSLALECTLVLFACSAGPGAFLVWLNHVEQAGAYIAVVGVPGSTALLFLAVSLIAPSLYSVDGLRFPLPITLPAAFCSMLPVTAMLWSSPASSLVSEAEFLQFVHAWERPATLVIALATQVLALSLLTRLRQEGW